MRPLTEAEAEQLAAFTREPDPASVKAARDLLFRAALLQHTVKDVSWRTFLRLTRDALLETNGDEDAWDRLAFARDIARRHLGEPALLAWPARAGWFSSLDSPGQLWALAHAVQSAADADLARVATYAAAAEATLADCEPSPEALVLRGAVGRALAATGSYHEAARSLEAAVHGWFALQRIPEASHALCELLRVRGVQHDASGIGALRASVEAFFDASPDRTSAVFVRLALGRALVQSGDLTGGADVLQGAAARWSDGPVHAQASRLRWLHFAALERLDDHVAEHRLAELDALRDEGKSLDSDQRYLARIDRALSHGTVLTPHIEQLLCLPTGDEAARTLSRLAPDVPIETAVRDRALVKKLAWEYRY